MHRFLMGLDFGDKRVVDHINHNKLDNRRENLRICTQAENQWNSKKQKDNTSGFKGVCKKVDKRTRKDGNIRIYTYWMAYIKIDGKQKFLGTFPFTEEGKELAKETYNKAAKEYFGEFACLNE